MKSLKKSIYLILATSIFISCESIVENLNDDPNNAQNADTEYILTGAQVANVLVHEGEIPRLTGMWSGYFTGFDRQYIALGQYQTTSGDADSPWGNLYSGVIQQAEVMIQQTEITGNLIYRGLAKILKANAYGTAADIWGDVPFSQAAQVEDFPNPAYDSQADVYAGVQVLLDEAIAHLTAQSASSISGDIHGLSTAQWIKVAYSLKARYFMHAKNYAAAYTAAQSGITNPADDLVAFHGSTYLGDFNVFYSFLDYDRPGYMAANDAYLTRLMDSGNALYRGNAKTNEEARFNFYYYDGIYTTGLEPNFLSPLWFDYPNGVFGDDSPYTLIGYAENTLTLAEAAIRSNSANPDVALGHLNDYRAYMNGGGNINPAYLSTGELGYTNLFDAYVLTDFDNGGIENADGQTRVDALRREILQERYVTFYGQIEGFNDIRRTRTDVMGVKPTPVTGSQLPQRMLYSQSEINSNSNTPS
ncbi:SusD/RagB family nutrient-binding outer membrane lipoprotein, partial [bacterium]